MGAQGGGDQLVDYFGAGAAEESGAGPAQHAGWGIAANPFQERGGVTQSQTPQMSQSWSEAMIVPDSAGFASGGVSNAGSYPHHTPQAAMVTMASAAQARNTVAQDLNFACGSANSKDLEIPGGLKPIDVHSMFCAVSSARASYTRDLVEKRPRLRMLDASTAASHH